MPSLLAPLAWGSGLGLGAALALVLGPSAPHWGMALAFPAAALILSVGALREDDGDELRHLTRFIVAFAGGYLAVAIPLAVVALIRALEVMPREPARVVRIAAVRDALLLRWAVIGLAMVAGGGALAVRWRRELRRRDPSPS